MAKFSKPLRKFGSRRYSLYNTYDSRRQASTEAGRLRRGKWLARVVHSSIGYDIYTLPRT